MIRVQSDSLALVGGHCTRPLCFLGWGWAHTDLHTILGSTVVPVHPHPTGDSSRVTNRPEPQEEDVVIGWDLWGQTPLNLQVRASCLF